MDEDWKCPFNGFMPFYRKASSHRFAILHLQCTTLFDWIVKRSTTGRIDEDAHNTCPTCRASIDNITREFHATCIDAPKTGGIADLSFLRDTDDVVLAAILPQAMPLEPLPPPPPPLPSLPDISSMYELSLWGVELSTFRYPTVNDEVLANPDHFYIKNESMIGEMWRDVPYFERACVATSPATAACATGILNCVKGARRCGSNAKNALDPFIDMYARLTPGRYLWAIRIELPRNEQLAGLFVGDKSVVIYQHEGDAVGCYEGNSTVVGIPDDRQVLIVCQPPEAMDAQVYALSNVNRVRLTLRGPYRQLWLSKVSLVERALKGARPSASRDQ